MKATGKFSMAQLPTVNDVTDPENRLEVVKASRELTVLEPFTSAAFNLNPTKGAAPVKLLEMPKASTELTPPQGLLVVPVKV